MLAEDKKVAPGASSKFFEGTVVSMTADKLVMLNTQGREYSHSLAKEAKLTCDGTVCEAEAIKSGSKVRVKTNKNDRNIATSIDSLDKDKEFAECCS